MEEVIVLAWVNLMLCWRRLERLDKETRLVGYLIIDLQMRMILRVALPFCCRRLCLWLCEVYDARLCTWRLDSRGYVRSCGSRGLGHIHLKGRGFDTLCP